MSASPEAILDAAAKALQTERPDCTFWLKEISSLSWEHESRGGGVENRVTEALAEVRVQGLERASTVRAVLRHPDDVPALFSLARAQAQGPAVHSEMPPWRAGPPATARSADGLSSARAEGLAMKVADALIEDRRVIQALLVRQTAERISVLRGDERRTEWRESEQLMVRGEARAGAVVDGVAQCRLGSDVPLDAFLASLRRSLTTLDAPPVATYEALPIVLRPSVAAPLLAGLSWLLSGAVVQNAPALQKALGKQAFPVCLTALDPPAGPLHRRTFDDEGSPCAPLRLIERGVLTNLLHTRASAAALGHAANGRCAWDEEGGLHAAPLNFALAPSPFTLPRRYIELDARIETFSSLIRPGHVLILASGALVEGDDAKRLGPVELSLPVFQTFRRLAGVGDDGRWLPAAPGALTPSLFFEQLPGVTSLA